MISLVKFLLVCLVFFGYSCSEDIQTNNGNFLLARVYNKSLYIKDLEGMFPPGTSAYDSSLITNAYTQRWVREAVLLYEAENNLPKDLNIDRLVRDYRSSLVRNNYEQVLLEQLMETEISKEELANFYDKNKIQYQLDNPIVKANVVVVPKIISVRDSLKYLWKNATDVNLARLKNICEEYELAHILDGNKWNEWENLAIYLPRNIGFEAFSKKGKDFSIQDGEFEVWVKILDSKKPQEIPPIEYVEEQLKRMLLLSRKTKLLEEKKEDMFDIAKRKGQIEIFYLK
ncbi:hypothetical protein LBMAG24_12500 [Bacteroidota bacterium]|nr:hypothetical protein LBMAG24_12500 [Bacteroidota bacterium]